VLYFTQEVFESFLQDLVFTDYINQYSNVFPTFSSQRIEHQISQFDICSCLLPYHKVSLEPPKVQQELEILFSSRFGLQIVV